LEQDLGEIEFSPAPPANYKVGDHVVYPHHGAGKVTKKEMKELLGYDRKVNTLDHPVSPRGHRILGRIPRLPKLLIQRIVSEFGGLEEILAASDAELEGVEGVGDVRAKEIREGLRRLQEINLVDRYLQT